MSARKKKTGHAAHIKQHTAGTSNEISFSVLDAAKNKLPEGEEKGSRASLFGKIALFTLPKRGKSISTPEKEHGLPLANGEFAAASVSVSDANDVLTSGGGITTSAGKKNGKQGATRQGEPSEEMRNPQKSIPGLAPEVEVARRKKRRRHQRIVAAAVTILVLLVLATTGGGYLYHEYQKSQDQIIILDDALAKMTQTDEVMASLDTAVANPLDDVSLKSMKELSGRLSGVQTQLEEASKLAGEAAAALKSPKEKEAALQTGITLTARLTLLDEGTKIMKRASVTKEAAQAVNEVWQEIVRADSLARDAAALVIDTTDEHIASSKTKSHEALAAFSVAEKEMASIVQKYTEINLDKQHEYILKRIEAIQHSIASDEAFLAKNKEEAAVQTDSYNRIDAEAANLASSFPSDPAEPVYAEFESSTAVMHESYSSARAQARSADAIILDYLGSAGK